MTHPLEEQPQKLHEEVVNCYRFYGRIFSTVIGWCVLLSVLPSLYIFFMPLLSHSLGNEHATFFLVFSVAIAFLVVMASAFLYCLILNLSYQRLIDESVDLTKAKKKARARYLQAIGGAVISVLTIFVVPLLVRIVLLYGNAFLSFLALGFGFFAFIVLTTTLIIYLPLIILEEHNFLRAIPEAFSLVQDNLFRIFTLIFCGWFIPLGLAHFIIHSLPNLAVASWLWLILHSILIPLVFVVMVVVYLDLKAHRQLAKIHV